MGGGFFYGPPDGFFYDEPPDWTPLEGVGPEDGVVAGRPDEVELGNALAPGEAGKELRADVTAGRLFLDPISLAPAPELPGLPGAASEQQVLSRAAAWMQANGWKPGVAEGRLVSMDGQLMVFLAGTIGPVVIRDLVHAGFVLLVVPRAQAIQNEAAAAVLVSAPQEAGPDGTELPQPPDGEPPAPPASPPPPPEM
jgi:hypothetical protein